MPNQRKKDKQKVGLWLSPEERARLKAVAKARHVSVSKLIRDLVEAEAKKEGIDNAHHTDR